MRWSKEKVGTFVEMARELAGKMILEMFSENETNFEHCTNSGGVVGNGGEIGWIGRGRRTRRRSRRRRRRSRRRRRRRRRRRGSSE